MSRCGNSHWNLVWLSISLSLSLSLSVSVSLPSFLSYHPLCLYYQLEVPHALYLAIEYNVTRGSCGKYGSYVASGPHAPVNDSCTHSNTVGL